MSPLGKQSELTATIRDWFDTVGQADGPVLPDEWFGGRPHENTFFSKDVRIEVSGETLTVRLSDCAELVVERLLHTSVSREGALVLKDYERAVMRWRGASSDAWSESSYDFGEIKFARPVG